MFSESGNQKTMLKNRRYTRAAWLSALLIGPALLADCSSGPALSLGDGAGAGNAGASNGGSAGTGGGSGGTDATCAPADCGPQLGIANFQCPDGSTAGPTGRCLKRSNGTCGWEVLSCPPGAGGSGGTSAGGSSSGGAGAGGQASGGTSSQTCGGKVCTTDQVCCGPAECGRCISKLSGQNCETVCAGGSGGASGSGGAGGADCSSLLADVTAKLAVAQGCNPASAKPGLECAGTLEGVCCPVLVEAAATSTNAANTAYLDALHSYQQQCSHVCPQIACFNPQPGDCVAASASQGTCGGGNGL